jgi:hypothetical protein
MLNNYFSIRYAQYIYDFIWMRIIHFKTFRNIMTFDNFYKQLLYHRVIDIKSLANNVAASMIVDIMIDYG